MTVWTHRSFRARLTGLVALAVGVAIALAATASYFAVNHQLNEQAKTNLTQAMKNIPPGFRAIGYLEAHGLIGEEFLPNGTLIQYVQDPQKVGFRLPATKAQLAMANRPNAAPLITNWRSGGQSYRLATTATMVGGFLPNSGQPIKSAGILVVAQPLDTVQHTLSTLKLILFLVAIGGILLALGLGSLVARTTIRPVKRLTAAAEHVATTQQLDATIDVGTDDELGRLAQAFNQMLGALGASRQQQAQLVSDAGHELRTPLTSLRTNVELLVRARDLPEDDRRDLLGDVTAQLEELTTLIGDLVEMARQEEQQPEPTEVRLDSLVEHAVERAQRRAPSLRFDVALTPGSVRAQPPLLERAVLNVLDNAAKWSPPGGTVEVTLVRGERWSLDVRDHGPGIAAEDLSKVFDRFYRAQTARSMPGSGLGLAIVEQVVTSHGGTVTASLPTDGGTLMRIELPIVVEQEPAGASLELTNGHGVTGEWPPVPVAGTPLEPITQPDPPDPQGAEPQVVGSIKGGAAPS